MVETDQHMKMNMRDLDPRENGRVRPKANNELQKIQIGAVAKRLTFIGRELPEPMKPKLTYLFKRNADLFTWAPENMPRVDLKVISHRLEIEPKV